MASEQDGVMADGVTSKAVAHARLVDAQRAYLVASGWVEDWTGHWIEPRKGHRGNGRARSGRLLDFQHAVNSQLYADRAPYEPRPPETSEQKIARYTEALRWRLAACKTPERRKAIRGHIRWISRELGEAGAITHVQKVRLKRALHAKDHKTKGCSCGKEGAPW